MGRHFAGGGQEGNKTEEAARWGSRGKDDGKELVAYSEKR